MKQMVEIYIKLAELETKREVNQSFVNLVSSSLYALRLIFHLEILYLLG